jgi:asparagine synthase (glutamine-hydrolysing)
MCGIAGFWRPSGLPPNAFEHLAAMTGAIAHRGPDSSGHWFDDGTGMALGHRRLAILDLSDQGHQPMSSANGRFQLAYNGEVYNFAELRRELRSAGAGFRGDSDTEVLLAAFECWGVEAAVPRFAGMFSFALWDAAERALYLVRDRLGEKPLCYGWQGDTFLFGSDLHALRASPAWDATIDPGALSLYLRHGCVPAPWSIYSGISKVRPGTMRIVREPTPGAEPLERPYWSASRVAREGLAHPLNGSDQELLDAADVLLRRVVLREMRSDVPLGAFLSGGVDSSLVVALMQAQSSRPVKTFTIGFRETGMDEAGYARAVAAHLGTEHHDVYLTPPELLATSPMMATVYDEPFGDSSQIPTTLLAQLTRRHVTVSLSGDGGDELFGGYHRYLRAGRIWRRLRVLPDALRRTASRSLEHGALAWTRQGGGNEFMHRASRVARLIGVSSGADFYRHLISLSREPSEFLPGVTEPPTAFALVGTELPNETLLSQMMYLDLVSYLPDDILVKVDRATMSVGLESRAPLLDHEVAEFAWRLPRRAKIRDDRGKWLLRQTLQRYLPEALISRPKMGFAAPVGSWLRGPLREWAGDLLAPDRLRRAGLFSPQAVARIRAASERGVRQWDAQLWSLLMFESWRDGQATASPVLAVS